MQFGIAWFHLKKTFKKNCTVLVREHSPCVLNKIKTQLHALLEPLRYYGTKHG